MIMMMKKKMEMKTKEAWHSTTSLYPDSAIIVTRDEQLQNSTFTLLR